MIRLIRTQDAFCSGKEDVNAAGCSVSLSSKTVTRDEACSEFEDRDFMPVNEDLSHWESLFIAFIHPSSESGVCEEIWINAEYGRLLMESVTSCHRMRP